jgi:hypothetical protein
MKELQKIYLKFVGDFKKSLAPNTVGDHLFGIVSRLKAPD